MDRRRRAWLLLGAIGWLAAADALLADAIILPDVPDRRKQSHIPIPNNASRAEAERMLRERLGRAQDLRQAHELLEKILQDPKRYFTKEDLESLKQRLPAGQQPDLQSVDPQVIAFLKKWADEQKSRPPAEGRPEPKQFESLARLLDEQLKKNPGPRPAEKPPSSARPQPTPPPPPPPPPSPPSREEMKDARSRQWILNVIERMVGQGGQESAALRRAEQELRRERMRRAEEWLGLGKTREGLRSRLPEFGRSLRLEQLLKEGQALFSSRPLPPDFGGGYRPPSSGGNISDTLSDLDPAAADTSAWQLLLWLGLGAALVLAVWKSLAAQRERQTKGATGWKLGRWPVDPAAVGTRDELVRAFEYLTLLCLGPVARCWNHLTIADRLGSAGAERRVAAAELAELYEQARYAPPDEPLPAGELEAARRHLCFLAGASAA